MAACKAVVVKDTVQGELERGEDGRRRSRTEMDVDLRVPLSPVLSDPCLPEYFVPEHGLNEIKMFGQVAEISCTGRTDRSAFIWW